MLVRSFQSLKTHTYICDITYVFKIKIPSTAIVIMEKISFLQKIYLRFTPFLTGLRKILIITPLRIFEFVTPEFTCNNV